MVEIKEIQNAFVDELKRIEKREKEKALNPSKDMVESFFPAKKVNIDYDYLNEVVADIFQSGLFVYPKTKQQLSECVRDVVDSFIYEPERYNDKIEFIRDSFFDLPLPTLLKNHKSGKSIPLPTYTLTFDMRNLQGIGRKEKKSIVDLAKSGQYLWKHPYERSKVEKCIFDSKWIKGKINLNVRLPFAQCDLNNISNEMWDLLFKVRDYTGDRFELNDVTVSFMQEKIEDWNTRYLHTDYTLYRLSKLNEFVKEHGGNLYFSELDNSKSNTQGSSTTKWTFDQLVKANEKIDELANNIKQNKLSPFEAVLYICSWSLINLQYNDGCNDLELNNTILSAANTKKLRCVGFAEFVNAVLNVVNFGELDLKEYPNAGILETKKISCTTAKDENGSILPDHCESLIHIEDPKYKINGDYICDVNLINMLTLLTTTVDGKIKTLDPNLPSVKPFNSLYLKNLSEYRTILPDYRIFPYNPQNESYITYDTRVSLHDVEKISRDMRNRKFSNTDAYFKNAGIKKDVIPKTVDGQAYSEFLNQSNEIMQNIKDSQGSPISDEQFFEAYKKVIPILHPHLKKSDATKMANATLITNACIDKFFTMCAKQDEFSL